MKKLTAVILSVLLCLCFGACGRETPVEVEGKTFIFESVTFGGAWEESKKEEAKELCKLISVTFENGKVTVIRDESVMEEGTFTQDGATINSSLRYMTLSVSGAKLKLVQTVNAGQDDEQTAIIMLKQK